MAVTRQDVKANQKLSGVSTRVLNVLDTFGAGGAFEKNANALPFDELKYIEKGRRAILLRVSAVQCRADASCVACCIWSGLCANYCR